MNQADLEYIVGLVTQQVMAAMNQGSSAQNPQYEGMSKILVVGPENAPIPEDLCEDSVAFGLADYCTHKNILRYDRVIITDLTTTQLADIAMARVSDDVTDAVITALLNGIDTYMLESALSFRKMAGKGSTADFRNMSNVDTVYNIIKQIHHLTHQGRNCHFYHQFLDGTGTHILLVFFHISI